MKTEELILGGAVLFAGFLVAQRMGLLKKSYAPGGVGPSVASNTFQQDAEKGYDPANPGNYVFLEDLISGVGDNDWMYTPSVFDQTAKSILLPNTPRENYNPFSPTQQVRSW